MEDENQNLIEDKKQKNKNYAKQWREKNKDYHIKYYEENREKMLSQITAKKHCDVCNKDVTKLFRHNKTNKHLKNLEKALRPLDVINT